MRTEQPVPELLSSTSFFLTCIWLYLSSLLDCYVTLIVPRQELDLIYILRYMEVADAKLAENNVQHFTCVSSQIDNVDAKQDFTLLTF